MRLIILFIFLVSSHILQAQFNIYGKIINSNTQNPIVGATIKNMDTQEIQIVDKSGKFAIEQIRRIQIDAIGYQTKILNIKQPGEIIITLTPAILALEEVHINSQTIPIIEKYATDAVSVIEKTEMTRGNNIELHPILNQVPGVFMQNATLNTNRITIRGIGARNLFGTANIRTFFGDIPLTDGNGESSIEDLELDTFSGIEIHKGPSASSYGVGLGGTILLKPVNSIKGTQTTLRSSLSSFGVFKNTLGISHGNQKANLHIVASSLQSDGYRENNAYNRQTTTLTSTIEITPNNSLTLLGSYINLKAGIPSSLALEDFNNNPRQAAFTWGRAQGFEDVNYGIGGLTWQHRFSKNTSQNTSIFTSFRTNYEPRPFNILEEKSNSFGVRTRTLGTHTISKKEFRWSAGGELFFDRYNGKTFENRYQDFPVGTGSVQGNRLSDLDEQRNYYNLFAEFNYQLTSKLLVNAGVHLNQTFFDIKDRFLSDSNDASGTFEFNPIWSPKIGANFTLNTQIVLFGNIASGFSTPTTAETLLPEGEFNPDLRPEIGWNYEIGSRYHFFENKLYGSLSIYAMRVQDLLVSRRTVEDNFFAINAGKTTHNGIEFDLQYLLVKNDSREIKLFGNTSIYEYRFTDFKDLDDDFSGNDLTGVPSFIYNLGVDITGSQGFYGNLTFQHVDKIPANDANTVFSDSYDLLQAKIGYTQHININNGLQLTGYIGANNILDTKYVSQLQINARGFGNNAPRYFYPGLPFTMYGGINISYRL